MGGRGGERREKRGDSSLRINKEFFGLCPLFNSKQSSLVDIELELSKIHPKDGGFFCPIYTASD